MAAKLRRAKEIALEIDPEFYRSLWVNSHESCPDWMPPPDEAASDSYLGNGFFSTWCLDVVHHQLTEAARDPRFAYGETLLTVWPPPANFAGINAVSRVIHVDDDNDGRADHTVTVPMPIFHVLGQLADLGDRYWVLPEHKTGGHRVSGFASSDDRGTARILLYSHHAEDTQSRSDDSFEVTLEIAGVGWEGAAKVVEYQFDQVHNSPFKLARTLRDRPSTVIAADSAPLAEVIRSLEAGDLAARRQAIAQVSMLDAAGRQAALPSILKLAGQEQDPALRALASDALKTLFAPPAYPRAEVEQIQKLCEVHPSGTAKAVREPNGHLRITTRIAANGCVFLTVDRAHP
jgi:hypothetical protein